MLLLVLQRVVLKRMTRRSRTTSTSKSISPRVRKKPKGLGKKTGSAHVVKTKYNRKRIKREDMNEE